MTSNSFLITGTLLVAVGAVVSTSMNPAKADVPEASIKQIQNYAPGFRAYPYLTSDKTLAIGISQGCRNDFPRAIYQVSNGSGGVIKAADSCPGLNPIKPGYQYKFQDLVGKERCIGRVSFMRSNQGYNSTWYIDGSAQKGSKCSTAGKIFKVNNIEFDTRSWENY